MPFIVCKFGGSSLAAGDRFLRVRDIIRSDPSRRAIVVSAPGRRDAKDEKITDLLIRYFETGDEALWRAAETRFLEIGETIGADAAPLLQETREAILRKPSAAFAAGRGEYLSARLLARLLGFRFVDAMDCVRFTEGGALDRAATRREMLHCLCGEPFVLPGFYGADAARRAFVFPRGGGDITGALVAANLGADVYENWTDVDGVYDRDPAVDPRARRQRRLTYDQMESLAAAGANVLHPDSLRPAREESIPVHVRSSFLPQASGTWIT